MCTIEFILKLGDISAMSLVAVMSYVAGFICALFALWRSRTPQGAAAWVVGLLSFPFLAVPLFLIFGHNKFIGYIKQRRDLDQKAQNELADSQKVYAEQIKPPGDLQCVADVLAQSKQLGFTGQNQIELLINAEKTYSEMFAEIKSAKKYILFQFYVFRTDEIGNRFAELLIEKARQGVRVYFLCDKIGTKLSRAYLKKLKAAGVATELFESTKSVTNRWQINFRNHRKLLIVDGETVFVGGINVGDDYLGRWASMGAWRDTHVKIKGPAALAGQISFAKDWYWTKEEMPDLDWNATHVESGSPVLLLHTGPADPGDEYLLVLLALLSSAKQRIWISTPYFVPPETIINALALAALRGLDVRVILPSYSDNRWVQYASEVYVEKLLKTKVKFFKYTKGFLHQKVLLIDDQVAAVGSANMDTRSIFINFEIMAISADTTFIQEMNEMFQADFADSDAIHLKTLEARPFLKKLVSRASNLMAPML